MSKHGINTEPYVPILDLCQTQTAIQIVKDFFSRSLAAELNLRSVESPLMVPSGQGINDDLNGIEIPVRFPAPTLSGKRVEIVQSLAKWKRLCCHRMDCLPGEGIVADMRAIRPDERVDHLHSLYVDQWDWEQVIAPEQRTLNVLVRTAQAIYSVVKRTEHHLYQHVPKLRPALPGRMRIVHAASLAHKWPRLSPFEREHRIARQFGAVFIVGIGAPLPDGRPHDKRAPDYDDWTTPNGTSIGLNGDIVLYHPTLDQAVELSSMGIRVNAESLDRQLRLTGTEKRRHLLYHRKLLRGDLPQTIGGGIGQSRLCMVLLKKIHIGEVQASIWPDNVKKACQRSGIPLL